MGKLNLSHQTSRPRPESQPSSRFGSLIDGNENPFRVAAQDTRRKREKRRQPNVYSNDIRASQQDHTNNVVGNNSVKNQGRIYSRQSRVSVPVFQLKEDTLFPVLDTINTTQNASISSTVPSESLWKRSGVDVIESTSRVVVPTNTNETDDDYIRPGWVRISRRGIEYGPPSDNYEKVLAANRRTQYVIHREILMRSKRITSDNRDIYGDENINIHSAISDDDGSKSDDTNSVIDGNFSDDDGSKKGADGSYSDDEY